MFSYLGSDSVTAGQLSGEMYLLVVNNFHAFHKEISAGN